LSGPHPDRIGKVLFTVGGAGLAKKSGTDLVPDLFLPFFPSRAVG
jgi:hypothetical protein